MSPRTRPRFRDATEARHAYRRLEAPRPEVLDGDWRVQFIGQDWFLDLHGRARKLLGIGKLHGLRFRGLGATHLVGNPKRRLEEAKPVDVDLGVSVVDGLPCVVLSSAPGNGALWDRLRTEIRQLDEDTLVGVDLFGPPQLTVPLPFVLHRHQGKALK